ncbi:MULTISPECIES: hypothetical protein [unclassified Serratia (in: enterobacteria)]|uniref:hypothetical protein n=1 Tax=unclassified Serratia (in: enterobacteria) TaxID=2647522 RepID=UPI0012FEE20B|nr:MULTISPECIES: hypothetical protein [unclassified Serratia (in: enterobacteria)]
MKTIVITLAFTGAVMLLSGCVITPPGENNHHHNSNTITRDGVTLPNCETLPDASQADNGSRCWYR